MGFADRYYNRVDASRVYRQNTWYRGKSVVFWLIAINVVVFVLDAILLNSFHIGGQINVGPAALVMGPLEYFGYFSASTAVLKLQLWRFITFQFLHASPGHIFFNMLALYFFGPMIESYLGSRRFLAFYLLCGVSGAASYLLLWGAGVLVSASWTPLVGASAGIFGVLVAGARIAPNATVMLLFPPIPMRLKVLAWILVGFGAYMVLTGGHNAGGEAAHLGGAAVGFVLIRNIQWLNFAVTGFASTRTRSRILQAPQHPKRSRHADHRAQDEIDRILMKVKNHGLASLTDKEKKALQRETERQRRVG